MQDGGEIAKTRLVRLLNLRVATNGEQFLNSFLYTAGSLALRTNYLTHNAIELQAHDSLWARISYRREDPYTLTRIGSRFGRLTSRSSLSVRTV